MPRIRTVGLPAAIAGALIGDRWYAPSARRMGSVFGVRRSTATSRGPEGLERHGVGRQREHLADERRPRAGTGGPGRGRAAGRGAHRRPGRARPRARRWRARRRAASCTSRRSPSGAARASGRSPPAAVDAGHGAVARDGPHRVGAKRSRSANACLPGERVEDPPHDAARSQRSARLALPPVDQPFDVSALGLGEVETLEQPPRLGRVVVGDRRLEVLALRRGLPELAAEPAEEAHGGLVVIARLRYSGGHVPGDREPPRRSGATAASRCPTTSSRASSTPAAWRARRRTGSRGRSSSRGPRAGRGDRARRSSSPATCSTAGARRRGRGRGQGAGRPSTRAAPRRTCCSPPGTRAWRRAPTGSRTGTARTRRSSSRKRRRP